MTEHNQKLEPSAFEPGGSPTSKTEASAGIRAAVPQRAAANSQRVLISALVGLGLVALAVFFWLPALVTPPTVETAAATPLAGTATRPTARTESSPWSDAQLAKQRKQAQDVLELLLEQQFDLEEMSVEQWAAEAFAAAMQLATSGDELYRQQQFEEAAATYQLGLEAMSALMETAPGVFTQQLQAGLDAIAANQSQPALDALTIALLIRPDSTAALAAQARALTLPEVMQLLKQAQAVQQDNDLEQAATLVEQALELDPAHAMANNMQTQLRRDIARRDFNRAMTAGYQAMDSEDYDTAEARFLAAQKLLPAAAETSAALTQARSARTLQRIDAYRSNATVAERNEDWAAAKAAFEAILRIDETVQFARQGAQRSRERESLDKSMQQALQKPERLANEQVYAETRQLLDYAAKLEPAGPRLRRQVAELYTVMEQSLKPIAVLLQSDEATDVTVYRVAHLGTFRRQQLELKPGTYTAVGVRTGYRDVRRQFTLSHNQSAPIITIACTDPI